MVIDLNYALAVFCSPVFKAMSHIVMRDPIDQAQLKVVCRCYLDTKAIQYSHKWFRKSLIPNADIDAAKNTARNT